MANPRRVKTGQHLRIGIDLGGTKTEVIAIGPSGEELLRQRVASPQGCYPETLSKLRDLVASFEERLNQRAKVGIGIPGSISPMTGNVRNANSTWLNGQPLQADLEDVLGRHVRVENDANCFTVSEAADGGGAGHRTVFGVILGTGVGGGLAIDGRVMTGRNAISGEWGHNPLPWPLRTELPGPSCYCGLQGCLETYLSGPALSRDYEAVAGEAIRPTEIAERANRDDTGAVQVMDRYIDRLARGLASVINLLDPDIIVLGGGVSNIASLYDRLPQNLNPYVFSDYCDTPIVPARYGDSSGVRGAAWLWQPDEDDRLETS